MSWQSITGTDVTGAAISTSNDTNILITASGNTTNALLRTLTLTTGWTGQLAVGRGGTGASTLTGVVIGNATSNMTAVAGTAGQFLRRNLANSAYEFRTLQGGDIAGSELTKTDDTNVTLSLSGTPASSLLQPVNIALGWTGTLAVSRGGIGVGTITGVMIGNGTSAVTGVTGTANQILRRNAGNTAYEFWTANYMVNPMNLEGQIIYALTGGTPAALSPNSTSTRKYLSQINGTAPTWEALSFPTGSGTTNYVPKWTSATVLGDSQIQWY
jgi:flagellar hook-associated protein FlgK